METRTLPIGPEEATRYPAARSPIIGVLMGVEVANLTSKVTIAVANDLATTSTIVPQAVKARVTNVNVWKRSNIMCSSKCIDWDYRQLGNEQFLTTWLYTVAAYPSKRGREPTAASPASQSFPIRSVMSSNSSTPGC